MSHPKILLLPLAFGLMTAGSAAAQQAPAEPPVVVTNGEGIVQAAPDRAWITVSAESRARNPQDAQRRNAEAMSQVIDKLRGAGVAAEAIRTIGYDLRQEWDVVKDQRVSRGYVARNTIDLRVDSIDRVGELLEIAVSSGATAVDGIRFDLKDRKKLERDALRLAVEDARARAEAVAAAAGRTIDAVRRIDVQTGGIPIPLPRVVMMREQSAVQAADAPPISAGEMEIRAQVTVTSSLK